ncbi:MAG: polysaccharide lyase family protein [Armatimonadetes bacterium]|nr:polysaccharide lyase family protein [Armatimonadota bacterium]
MKQSLLFISLILILIALGGGVGVDEPSIKTLWRIGSCDRSFAGFALAPSDARKFAELFKDGVEFVVGASHESQFPFIHPSKADIAWGGKPEVPFVIRFHLFEVTQATYALFIALADSHESLPSTMIVTVNGKQVWRHKMPLGHGRAFFGDADGKPSSFTILVPSSALRRGENELTITLTEGSWVAYDCLEFVQWTAIKLPEPLPTPPNALLPEPKDFSAVSALLFPQPGGFHAKADRGAVLLNTPLLDTGFRVHFLLSILSGQVTIGRKVPSEQDRDIWSFSFFRQDSKIGVLQLYVREPGPSGGLHPYTFEPSHPWLRLTIEQMRDRVVATIVDGDKLIGKMEMIHPPLPPGPLSWTANQSQWAVSHLSVEKIPTPAKTAKPRRRLLKDQVSLTPSEPSVEFHRKKGHLILSNSFLELQISTAEGINPHTLKDRRTGRRYADERYCYGNVTEPLPKLIGEPEIVKRRDQSIEITLTGDLILLSGAPISVPAFGAPFMSTPPMSQNLLRVQHKFRMFSDALEERLQLTNIGRLPAPLSHARFGFVKKILDKKGWRKEMDGCRFVAVPYRREPETGDLMDFAAEEIAWRSGWFHLINYPNVPHLKRYHTPGTFGSEGWVWVDPDGDHALLIAKYNNQAMEWSVLSAEKVLIFGGAALWKLGDPEPAQILQPGKSVTFGITRYLPVRGGWKGAFYAFRNWMDSLGHKFPKNYNPPVHWNELYDNPLWWGPDTPERRQEFYRKEHMEEEARKARELGCEALYLDPGWDTSFASSIWDEGRLGRQVDFVKMLQDRYSLKLSLHTPLAGWSDVNAYPQEARRKQRDGTVLPSLCSSAPAYLKTKSERLLRLCQDGASFLMFDGTAFTGECYDDQHGHSLPLTRHEHCQSYLKLIQSVKKRYPNVLIELHDPIVGGVMVRYAPTYFLHNLPHSFDELWGYEFMWDPMSDLLSGRALSLYYVRLAYNIPIYLHIDLRKDNENALMFWWYASTCQHLGVGGKHPDPRVWEAHKKAMQTYKRLKPFYTQGEFFGIEETVHAHTLRKATSRKQTLLSVINFFNLDTEDKEKVVSFSLSEIGLPPSVPVHCIGASYQQEGERLRLSIRLPARGHQLVEIYSR